jgi:hypothetical protein
MQNNLAPSLGTTTAKEPRFYRAPARRGFKNGGLMGEPAKTRRLFEFVLWAQQQPGLPTAKAVADRFSVSLPVAYRWRELYADLTGQPIPCMGTGRRAKPRGEAV